MNEPLGNPVHANHSHQVLFVGFGWFRGYFCDQVGSRDTVTQMVTPLSLCIETDQIILGEGFWDRVSLQPWLSCTSLCVELESCLSLCSECWSYTCVPPPPPDLIRSFLSSPVWFYFLKIYLWNSFVCLSVCHVWACAWGGRLTWVLGTRSSGRTWSALNYRTISLVLKILLFNKVVKYPHNFMNKIK